MKGLHGNYTIKNKVNFLNNKNTKNVLTFVYKLHVKNFKFFL